MMFVCVGFCSPEKISLSLSEGEGACAGSLLFNSSSGPGFLCADMSGRSFIKLFCFIGCFLFLVLTISVSVEQFEKCVVYVNVVEGLSVFC